tara:strand:- start:17 stop:130 length:114 start_codon:yes stop_codon:yes gene_type:complete
MIKLKKKNEPPRNFDEFTFISSAYNWVNKQNKNKNSK